MTRLSSFENIASNWSRRWRSGFSGAKKMRASGSIGTTRSSRAAETATIAKAAITQNHLVLTMKSAMRADAPLPCP